MCSNNNGGGKGTGRRNGGRYSGSGSNLKLKKQKQERVPQRGPGVVLLEKKLREDEMSDRSNSYNVHGYSSLQYPPMIPTRHVMSGSNTILPVLTQFPDESSSRMNGKYPILPWGYPIPTAGPSGQTKYPLPPRSMTNHFLNQKSLAPMPHMLMGRFQPFEQLVNQRPHPIPMLPQNDKMVGKKRPWSSMNPSPFYNQASPVVPLQFSSQGNYNGSNLNRNQTYQARDKVMNKSHYGGKIREDNITLSLNIRNNEASREETKDTIDLTLKL